MAESGIDAVLKSGALGAATAALAAHQGRATRAALRLLWAQPGLRARTRVHAAVLLARSLVT
jgi:hypothetical protein